MEKDYEKIGRLFQLRREYASRVGTVDEEIAKERTAVDASEREALAEVWLSRRLDAGLFSLQVMPADNVFGRVFIYGQTIDTIFAWLIAEDDGAKSKIDEYLKDRDESLEVIRKSLQGPL